MRTRLLLAAILLSVLIALAVGRGNGDRADAAGGLDYVPKSAVWYLTVDTDFSSDDWSRVRDVARRISAYRDHEGDVVDFIARQAGLDYDTEVRPWIGDDAGAAMLRAGSVVAWADVDDAKQAAAVMRDQVGADRTSEYRGTTLHVGDYGAWCIADNVLLYGATTRALKSMLRAESRNASVQDVAGHDDVGSELADGAPVRFYLSGPGLRKYLSQRDEAGDSDVAERALAKSKRVRALRGIAGSFDADNDAFIGQLVSSYDTKKLGSIKLGSNGGPALLESLPASTLAALTLQGADHLVLDLVDALRLSDADLSTQIALGENALGVQAEELAELFADGAAVTLSREGPLSLTAGHRSLGLRGSLVLPTSDEQRNRDLIDRVLRGARFVSGSKPVTRHVAGEQVQRADFGEFQVSVATFDGRTVVSNTESAFAYFVGPAKLKDTDGFRSAWEAADIPGEVSGALYADTQTLLGWLGPHVPAAPIPVRPDLTVMSLRSNGLRELVRSRSQLEPLVGWSVTDNGLVTSTVRLGVRQ